MSEQKQRKKRVSASDALSGGWLNRLLSRYAGIALLVCVVIMVGMWQNFYYQNTLLREARMKQSLEEERRRSLVYTAVREEASRPTHIKQEAEKLGLQMLADPPKKVKVKRDSDGT